MSCHLCLQVWEAAVVVFPQKESQTLQHSLSSLLFQAMLVMISQELRRFDKRVILEPGNRKKYYHNQHAVHKRSACKVSVSVICSAFRFSTNVGVRLGERSLRPSSLLWGRRRSSNSSLALRWADICDKRSSEKWYMKEKKKDKAGAEMVFTPCRRKSSHLKQLVCTFNSESLLQHLSSDFIFWELFSILRLKICQHIWISLTSVQTCTQLLTLISLELLSWWLNYYDCLTNKSKFKHQKTRE